jgi:hypothetical protein
MDQDPIKQLQSFLDERGKMLERISGIHSTLDSIRADISPSPSARPVPEAQSSADDLHFRRLMQTLHDMQAQIEDRVRPAVQLVARAQVERLRDQSDQQLAALRDCLAQIDQSILHCLSSMDEYQRRCADLDALNQSLIDLGATPEPLPDKVSFDKIGDSINARLADLKAKGRM